MMVHVTYSHGDSTSKPEVFEPVAHTASGILIYNKSMDFDEDGTHSSCNCLLIDELQE
jgi:hypothetical protein